MLNCRKIGQKISLNGSEIDLQKSVSTLYISPYLPKEAMDESWDTKQVLVLNNKMVDGKFHHCINSNNPDLRLSNQGNACREKKHE